MANNETVDTNDDGWVEASGLGFAPEASDDGWHTLDAGAVDMAATMTFPTADEMRSAAASLTPAVVDRAVDAGDDGWLSVADDRLDLDLALKTMTEEAEAVDAPAHDPAGTGYSVTDTGGVSVPVDESSFS